FLGKIRFYVVDDVVGNHNIPVRIHFQMHGRKIPVHPIVVDHDVYCAKYTRFHNDANMIAFGEKVVGVGLMEEIVNAFLTCEYEGGERHDRRIAKIAAIEKKYNK
ncbi:MAG: RpiB/LacA/LacB family sugar-phosphate isomerase, partial [Clostridia bacterium]|nr:RpiB/LacA/LacB family sugar-phosphate isomerase [Clostridia bacterium]